MNEARTLLDKIWEAHTVATLGTWARRCCTSTRISCTKWHLPQAFEALHLAGRGVWRPDRTGDG